MPWTKSPLHGQWTRPMGVTELLGAAASEYSGTPLGSDCFAVSAAIQIKQGFSTTDILLRQSREAWVALRYKHPSIAVTREGDNLVYNSLSEEEIGQWVAESFIVEPKGRTTADVVAGHRVTPCGVTMHFLPETSEYVMQGSHWILDGIGIMMLVDEYLKTMIEKPRDIEFGDEAIRLVPDVETLLGLPQEMTPEQEASMCSMRSKMEEFKTSLPCIGFKATSNQISLFSKRESMRYDKKMTAKIIQACKNRGCSVTSAFHAALPIAMREMSGDDVIFSDRPYSMLVPVNMRSHCPVPFDSAASAATINLTLFPVVLPNTSFSNNLAVVHARTSKIHKDDLGKIKDVLPAMHQMTTAMMRAPLPPNTPPGGLQTLSSLGIVESYIQRSYGAIDVTNFYLAVKVLLSQPTYHLWTFRDQLEIGVCWGEAFQNAEMYVQFLKVLKKTISKELDIGME